MRRTKTVFAVFALLAVMVSSAAPAMAQSAPPWGMSDYWTPPDSGDYSGYPSNYYDLWSPSDYYDNAYQQFQDNCLGVILGEQCIGIGQDLGYYMDNYGGGFPYQDPYNQDTNNWGSSYWDPFNQGQ